MYVCVLILLRMSQHAVMYVCVLILVYMCPHTVMYVYICMCPHTVMCVCPHATRLQTTPRLLRVLTVYGVGMTLRALRAFSLWTKGS